MQCLRKLTACSQSDRDAAYVLAISKYGLKQVYTIILVNMLSCQYGFANV